MLRILAAILGVLCCGGLANATAARACDEGRHVPPVHARPSAGPAPLAIGDSVMLGAAPQLAAAGYEVDAHGCRQMAAGLDLLAARRRAGDLPHLVVVGLGTNWVITPGDIARALRIAGPSRMLGLITPRELGGGSGRDAAVVRAAGRRHPTRVLVLDWVAFSAGHGAWFAPDGIHLGPAGAGGYARLLRRALPYRFARPLG